MSVKKQIRPFHSVLVANRGEIALRIIHSARKLGYRTVAVYSDADRDSPHVQVADSAVCIGGALPRESYLNIDAILAAAGLAEADAIHPGYGFLAENEAFANAVDAAGLVFIGPTGAAIEAMGNKARAKQLMQEAGMPCIPGYQDADQSDAVFLAAADAIGFPVMVKAAAGGGGRGMRLVHSSAEMPGALASARSEALQAFGNAELILERAVIQPRHIEIQLLADAHGHCIHLGERDCSIQRRHQKVIEEAPSTAVSPELRQRMGAAAVRAAQAIGYIGAGTMEFLLDAQGQFYFMEMNTRLQVEHAVTEAITGLDLVAWQLRIAAGERLSLQQADVRFDGHAMEARLTAEDVPAGFLPQTGMIGYWRAPDVAPPAQWGGHMQPFDVRVEQAIRSGGTISPYYDSMIAKVVTHGATRDEARRKLILALQNCVLLGVPTNQPFLVECLKAPAFAKGDAIHTGFVAQHMTHCLSAAHRVSARTVAFAAIAMLSHWPRSSSRLKGVAAPLELVSDAQRWQIQVQSEQDGWRLRLRLQGGEAEEFVLRDLCWLDEMRQHFQAECNGLVEKAIAVSDSGRLDLHHAGQAWRVEIPNAYKSGVAEEGSGVVIAPLTGRVASVTVEEGQMVSQGQTIAVLEAMKMEHSLTAPLSGKVVELRVLADTQTTKGALLMRIEEFA